MELSNTPKQFINKAAIGVLVALLAVALGGDFIFIQKCNDLQADSKNNSDQIKALNTKLSAATKESDSWKEKYENVSAQINAESDDLKSQIKAFAKQAASCENIKKKLHLN